MNTKKTKTGKHGSKGRRGPIAFTWGQACKLLMIRKPKAEEGDGPPTEPMLAWLESVGIYNADELTFGQAGVLLDALSERRDSGLCSLKQVVLLCNLGLTHAEAMECPFAEARTLISERLGKG